MMRLYSSRILIINIIIFSLFVCIFNADAAASADDRNVEDAAESPKKPVLLTGTGKEAQTHYEILLFNIADYIAAENSMILQACGMLSKSDLFQKSSFVVQEDIALILYTLSKESESHAEALVQTLRDGDVEVSQGEKVLLALGRCVPEFNSNDIRKITEIYKKKWKHVGAHKISQSRRGVERRYSRLKNEARFSAELKTILWKMCPIFANSELQFDNQKSDCLTGESAKKYYGILKSKLEQDGITVANSVMLKVCGELSQSDCFQKEHTELQVGIATALYILCQESVRNAKGLAHTFSKEGEKVSQGQATILEAFGRCVPEIKPNDLEEILSSLLNVHKSSAVVFNIRIRYTCEGFARFALALQNLLSDMGRKFMPQYTQPLQHQMSGAVVRQCPLPLESAVMHAECVYQSHIEDVDMELEDMRAYISSKILAEESAVMHAECAPQSQTKDLDTALEDMGAYIFSNILAEAKDVS